MRIVLIILLVALALWVIVAGLLSKKRTSRGRISWLLVFALLVPAGAATYFEYKWQTDIETISKNVVAKISGIPGAKLECQRLTFAFVDVWASEKTIDADKGSVGLKYNQCAQLFDYLRNEDKANKQPTLDQLKTFHLLSQESTRLAGKETKENNLVCLGAKNLPIVVEGLGATAAEGVYSYRLFVQELLEKDSDYSKFKC